jgi:hypothetical protein
MGEYEFFKLQCGAGWASQQYGSRAAGLGVFDPCVEAGIRKLAPAVNFHPTLSPAGAHICNPARSLSFPLGDSGGGGVGSPFRRPPFLQRTFII